jgi:hypothetical protein
MNSQVSQSDKIQPNPKKLIFCRRVLLDFSKMPVLKLPCSWVTISRGNHPNTEEIEELDVTLRSNGSGPCSYLLVIKDLTSKEIQQFEASGANY